MTRTRILSVFLPLIALLAAPAYAQYGMGGMGMGGMGMGGMGMGGMGMGGMGMYGWGGAGGPQIPNIVLVKEGEAIYCAMYGDLIDYNVYPRQVPLDDVAGKYYDDGTHGDEVAFDGMPSDIEENRDTYLGPFAIRYKAMVKKAISDALVMVMERGPFGILQKARAQAAAERKDVFEILADARQKTQSQAMLEMIDRAEKIAQNKMLLELLGEAKQRTSRMRAARPSPLQFYRIPVAAESAGSSLVQYESVNLTLTSKVEDWTENLLGQFMGRDGEPYDDETYRLQMDVTILQNQQGLGLQGYGSMGTYGGPMGGPPGIFGLERAREAAEAAEGAGGLADQAMEMPQ